MISMASKVLLIAVFVLDVIAFSLAIVAEQRRSTSRLEKREGNLSYCVYDKDIATGLGVASFLFLLASQAIVMVASRCLCCGSALTPGRSRTWAIILFITSWVFFFIAEVCLLAGSVRNAYHTKYRGYLRDPPTCRTLRKGVFGAGAAFIFLNTVATKLYYMSYARAKDDLQVRRDTGIRMGRI